MSRAASAMHSALVSFEFREGPSRSRFCFVIRRTFRIPLRPPTPGWPQPALFAPFPLSFSLLSFSFLEGYGTQIDSFCLCPRAALLHAELQERLQNIGISVLPAGVLEPWASGVIGECLQRLGEGCHRSSAWWHRAKSPKGCCN